jgi:glycosyltransferase involved in cell wall biosynthesis
MTRVVHIINSLERGGAERMLTRLVTHSHRPEMTHAVICLTGRGAFGDDIEACGAGLHTLELSAGPAALAAIPRIARLLKVEAADVLMTWLYHADFLGTQANRFAAIPRHYWNLRCSDMDLSRYSRATGWLVRLLARSSGRPDGIVVNSFAGRRVHERLGYRPRQWIDIANGYDLEEFCPSATARERVRRDLAIPSDVPVIGNIARVDPMKDHEGLLTALARLARTHADAHFLLAGDGVKDDAPPFAAAREMPELAGRIHLLGVRRDVPDLLAAMDVYVQSSAFGEGFPNVVAEAMATAVPAVVTDVGDAARIVGDEHRVVPPSEPEQLAAAIEAYLGRPLQERKATGARDRARIAANYDLDAIVARYDVLFAGAAVAQR